MAEYDYVDDDYGSGVDIDEDEAVVAVVVFKYSLA